MTATDELRCLLDERGATADESIYPDRRFALRVVGSDAEILIDNSYGKTGRFAVFNLTPAQVVEATLGRGTCMDESGGDPCVFACSECDAVYDHPEDEPIFYCPNCGRRVVGA